VFAQLIADSWWIACAPHRKPNATSETLLLFRTISATSTSSSARFMASIDGLSKQRPIDKWQRH
jgi:hypothetical protein